MIRTYKPSQIADAILAGDLVRETEFVLAFEVDRLRAFEAAHKQLQAALDIAIRERDEALEEIRCLGLSEALATHSGSPSREWHNVGAWLYPGETINHVFRSPREEPEDRP